MSTAHLLLSAQPRSGAETTSNRSEHAEGRLAEVVSPDPMKLPHSAGLVLELLEVIVDGDSAKSLKRPGPQRAPGMLERRARLR